MRQNKEKQMTRKQLARQYYETKCKNRYKSDKYKSRDILRSEITNIMVHGKFTKADLIAIRDLVKNKVKISNLKIF